MNVQSASFPGGQVRGQVQLVALPWTYGHGCPLGTTLSPEIGSMVAACVGSGFDITLFGAPPASPAVVLFGLSRDFLPGGARLPLSLAGLGAPDCYLLHDNFGFSLTTITDALGCAKVALPIPFMPAATGSLMAQWFIIAPGVNPLGMASSNGLEFPLR